MIVILADKPEYDKILEIRKYDRRKLNSNINNIFNHYSLLYTTYAVPSKLIPGKSIIIFCYDNSGKPAYVKNTITKITVNGLNKSSSDSKEVNLDMSQDGTFVIIGLNETYFNGLLARDGNPYGIKLTIQLKDTPPDTSPVYGISNSNSFESYGLSIFPDCFQNKIGIWAPIGLFGTNFQRTGSGMQFQTAPIGIAVGTKYYPAKESTYLGGSIFSSWAIGKTDSNNNSSNNNSSISAAGLTVGGLFDLSSWFYIGFAYAFDLTSNKRNPGWSMLIGPGPNLISFLNPLK